VFWRLLFHFAALGILLIGCSNGPSTKALNVDPSKIAKVKISRDGAISLNGQLVTFGELKASLLKISQSPDSAVWYYRENAASAPHPNAMLVLTAIVELKLPVRLSSKPDFSDSVVQGGTSPLPR
jgi:hypothetical protein